MPLSQVRGGGHTLYHPNTMPLCPYHRSGGGGDFVLDNATGEIKINAKLDFETTKEYTLVLNVEDYGDPKKEAEKPLKIAIKITDINDNKPVFRVTDAPTITLKESADKGRLLYRFEGSDTDSGDNAKFKFVIVSSSSYPFGVNETSGDLILTGEMHIWPVSPHASFMIHLVWFKFAIEG